MQDFKKIEEDMLKFWEENDIYLKAKAKNVKGKKFYFLQGPPYTSGRLHIGHAWNNSMKDLAMRYFRLKGCDVWDRAGYDMHGLPTENKVQKDLNLKDKDAIIDFGLDKFALKCKEFSYNGAKQMNVDLKRFGIWMDFEDPYLPITNEFMSAEWLLFKEAWNQKRLYKGKKVMSWCGTCETSLAKHELEYETLKEDSIFLKFKVLGKQNEYLAIWTTTPWTIGFNLAVMVNPDLYYVKAEVETKKGKEVWIVAKDLAYVFISGLMGYKFNVVDTFRGEKLEGLGYVHPLNEEFKEEYTDLKRRCKNVHTVILSKQYVDTSAGTGLVHCAPGCGPEDYEVGRAYEIEAFNSLDEKGVFTSGKFKDWVAKKDDRKFIEYFKQNGYLITETEVEHEYAHCWRCHKPIVFRTTEQWFLKIEDLVPEILEYNKKIKWEPRSAKDSYESWIANLRDNGVTRQRFWGTPAPIWECSCGHVEVIGDMDELKKKAITKVPEDLHKPWIDTVKIKCVKCGKSVDRIPDVLDVWLDSGTVSWNCLHYPQRKDYFEKYFPADLILEATEQTRLWFSMLQICSAIMFKKPCYAGAYNHGMIFDFEGVKMSKSLGNIVSPYEVVEKYSSDIFRYYICEITAGENINFNWEDVKQKQRNLIVFQNMANYLVQLKSAEGVEREELGIEEKYILSRLNSTIKNVTALFEAYKFDETITELEKLLLDISRVYIKMTRDKSLESPGIVYDTLKDVYTKAVQMFSTICPLFCENVWQSLRTIKIVNEESVHLTAWPKYDEKLIDLELEKEFEGVMKIIELGLAQRDKAQIGLKWPLLCARVVCDVDLNEGVIELISKQLNVKTIDYTLGKETSVKLDLTMTKDLEEEGFAREIMRKIQSLRKELGLNRNDRIRLYLKFEVDLRHWKNMIAERCGAVEINLGSETLQKGSSIVGDIKGKKFVLGIEKVNN
jgi:isoleucyl-tRNA synthetase